jgi:hypothetical protein
MCEGSKKFYVYRQEGVMFIYTSTKVFVRLLFSRQDAVKGEKWRGSCLVIQEWGRKGWCDLRQHNPIFQRGRRGCQMRRVVKRGGSGICFPKQEGPTNLLGTVRQTKMHNAFSGLKQDGNEEGGKVTR